MPRDQKSGGQGRGDDTLSLAAVKEAGPPRSPILNERDAALEGRSLLHRAGWALLSLALFAGLWELSWLLGLADPRLLPPPHIFLGDIAEQARHFNSAQRWLIGSDPGAVPNPANAVLYTVLATVGRVLAGITLAGLTALLAGMAIRYWRLFGKLTLPTITFLAPVSPVAWLPIAIFLFGIGNLPAIFLVFVALFFTMTVAVVGLIDDLPEVYIRVGRVMGASRQQIFVRVVLPAILPGFLAVLRLNLFAAWMVVLIAEATGVGYGLGQIIMLARNTFNPSLVFLTMAILGLIGYLFDRLFLGLERRILHGRPKRGAGVGFLG